MITVKQKTVSEKAIKEVSNQLENLNLKFKVVRISKSQVFFTNDLGTNHILFLCKLKGIVKVVIPEWSELNKLN